MIFLKNSGIQVGTMILNTIDFFKWLQFANATWPMIYVYFVPRAAPSPSLTWGCLACPTLPPSSTRRSLAFLRLARPRPKSCRQLMAAPRRPTSWQSRCRATTGSWTGLSGHSGCKSSRSSSSSRTQCCCDFPFCFGQSGGNPMDHQQTAICAPVMPLRCQKCDWHNTKADPTSLADAVT